MPERINAVHSQPSPHIIWIKPLPGPDSHRAQDFLERIAAIAHPIMKAHHLRITTLEEHEPNREFIGRNFNAGEIIQLVLKSRRTGQWLSFRMVQMVMMHELAHCLQMNHRKDFWKTNDAFKTELRELWAKGYTGEGIWGRGRTLLSGEYDRGSRVNEDELPENLCGGAYRSRRRRRKRRLVTNEDGIKREETWAQAKQRRIEKKFGVNGTALGDDQEVRVKLENGQKVKGKPRVANSGRGRELRAAAALARFGQQKTEEAKEEIKSKGDPESQSGITSADEYEEDYEEFEEGPSALDVDGTEMLDANGGGMVRVCGDEDQDEADIKKEMEELQDLGGMEPDRFSEVSSPPNFTSTALPPDKSTTNGTTNGTSLSSRDQHDHSSDPPPPPGTAPTQGIQTSSLNCPICSMENESGALLCLACSNVLDPQKVTNWKCQSDTCKTSQYLNAGDVAMCGVCGARNIRVERESTAIEE